MTTNRSATFSRSVGKLIVEHCCRFERQKRQHRCPPSWLLKLGSANVLKTVEFEPINWFIIISRQI